MLLVNLALNSLLCLNLHPHYFHIKNIIWITVASQIPQQNYFGQNIPTSQASIRSPLSSEYVSVQRIFGRVTIKAIKIRVLSCIKDKSFLFTFLLFLLTNLTISWGVQEPKFFPGTLFQLQKLCYGQSCRIGSKFDCHVGK